jgi:predicted Zn-ribbon and HTH transcriptional regulator
MTQNTDARRDQVIRRLQESGFKPQAADEILRMIDDMMAGRATLAHVLVAAAEVCKTCGLISTRRHVTDAMACLAGEVLQYRNPSLDGQPDDSRPTGPGIAYWNPVEQGRA